MCVLRNTQCAIRMCVFFNFAHFRIRGVSGLTEITMMELFGKVLTAKSLKNFQKKVPS